MTFTPLNPTAPSFPPTTTNNAQNDPPSPPATELSAGPALNLSEDSFQPLPMAKPPNWALTIEDEHQKVAALTISKLETRDAHAERLRTFIESLLPGYTLAAASSDGSSSTTKSTWKPLAVRQMPAPPPLGDEITTHGLTFAKAFLEAEFGGSQWSPGFYFVPDHEIGRQGVKAYWLLDAAIDPYLPPEPGQHGAKFTAVFNSAPSEPGMAPTEADYMDVPVFIRWNGQHGYRYYGHYSQTRYSDKLDYERMIDGTVPAFVLDVWAKTLTKEGREDWVTEELIKHFWPKPEYVGPMPFDDNLATLENQDRHVKTGESPTSHDHRVKRAIEKHTAQLDDWRRESKTKVNLLTEKNILDAFRAPDADEVPGLRLYWEYFECVGYKEELYDSLVAVTLTAPLQRGYAERKAAALKDGWTERAVPTTSASGHETTVMRMCPPSQQAKVRVAKKTKDMKVVKRADSVVGQEEETSSKPNHWVTPWEGVAKHEMPPTVSQAKDTTLEKHLPPHKRAMRAHLETGEKDATPLEPKKTDAVAWLAASLEMVDARAKPNLAAQESQKTTGQKSTTAAINKPSPADLKSPTVEAADAPKYASVTAQAGSGVKQTHGTKQKNPSTVAGKKPAGTPPNSAFANGDLGAARKFADSVKKANMQDRGRQMHRRGEMEPKCEW